MLEAQFPEPVVVPAANGVCHLTTVRQALRAVSNGQIGGFALERPDWQQTMDLLVRAHQEPTPERIEAARTAIEMLARVTAPTH